MVGCDKSLIGLPAPRAWYPANRLFRRVGAERSDRNLGERRRRRREPMKAHRVLIVEDDALLGVYLAELLIGMGHEICAIEATEADAVSAAAQRGPDLMIVDARLRDGSGISAV